MGYVANSVDRHALSGGSPIKTGLKTFISGRTALGLEKSRQIPLPTVRADVEKVAPLLAVVVSNGIKIDAGICRPHRAESVVRQN